MSAKLSVLEPIPNIRCIQQLAFLTLWNRLRADTPLPHVSALHPNDLSRMACKLMFCDVVSSNGADRFYVRYQGADITRYSRFDGTGCYLDSADYPTIKRDAIPLYCKVKRTGVPAFNLLLLQSCQGGVVHYARLLLPFTRKGESVDRIVSVVSLFSEDNGFPPDIVVNGRVVGSLA